MPSSAELRTLTGPFGLVRGGRLVAGLVLALVLAGCQLGAAEPVPSPTPTVTPRPFTVMSTDPVRVTDPAAINDAGSSMFAENVFQRLMTAAPGESVLKPDLARDCIFTSLTTYTCTLNAGTTFHNGDKLTSSDVKFSIERATRLNVPGTSVSLLSSLRQIETPDEDTVRFLLGRPDTQFGWALASPAASIVDEQIYDPDQVRPIDKQVVGSGPFIVNRIEDGLISFSRNAHYVGRTPAALDTLVYRTAADSATIEEAMASGQVDVVWRGLDAAAVTRYQQQVQQSPEQLTADGYAQQVLTGKRVRQLVWSPSSPSRPNRGLRQAITLALQGDRTSESVVPAGVVGQTPAFPLGGKAAPKVTWNNRITLALCYDPTMPDGQDEATQIRTRLENTGGLSVQLRPDSQDCDLTLLDRKAWTATALAWLQPYVDAPLPDSAPAVQALENEFRVATDDAAADRFLVELQKQAALDQVVLPVSQSDDYLYTAGGVTVSKTSYGPGWQLGLFGMNRG